MKKFIFMLFAMIAFSFAGSAFNTDASATDQDVLSVMSVDQVTVFIQTNVVEVTFQKSEISENRQIISTGTIKEVKNQATIKNVLVSLGDHNRWPWSYIKNLDKQKLKYLTPIPDSKTQNLPREVDLI